MPLYMFLEESSEGYTKRQFDYVVSGQNNPMNHPIYVVDEYLACCILFINEEYNETQMLVDPLISYVEEVDSIWKMFFYGAYSK
jgi:hypothetical protein